MITPMKLTLKHGRGKVHDPNCPWLNGKNAKTDWTLYHLVPASEVIGKARCSHCGG
jgi:hypothetical protein